jgi:hypothetical protein
MRSQNHTFFSLIASETAKENYLSRIFQACFANSAGFRQIALDTIWKICELRPPIPDAENWECDYQPPTPSRLGSGGRPDLALRPAKKTNFDKPIFLESKVDSPLTESQLKNYKDHGTKILVVVTKKWPEVSRGTLLEQDVRCLRWQDFCRAMRQSAVKGQKEQFLCRSFAEYLEDSDMAFGENLTKQHLDKIRSLLNKITSSNEINSKGEAFNYAHCCLELLRDVRASVLDRIPKLKQWTTWGPSYYQDGEEVTTRDFALAFTPGGWRPTEPYISGRLRFPAKGPVSWVVLWRRKHGDMHPIRHSIESVCSTIKDPSGVKVKALDVDRMSKTFEEAGRKLHIV